MTEAYSERDGFAAEYVLGTLEAAARREAEALCARDPAFAELVAAWQQHLAPLADDIQPVAPPPELLGRIEKILDILGAARAAAPPKLQPGRQVRTAWRWSAFGAGAIAAALAIYIAATELIPEAPGLRYVAVLNQSAATPMLMVTLDFTADRMIVRPVAAPEAVLARQLAAGERALELWLVPPGGGAPRSLGLLPTDAKISIALTPEMEKVLLSAVALAVSVEPPGGSPSGAPTGPVIYQGAVLPSAG
ncbi:MAG: anti-sigma factor [Proteobacteria bacterium]|nr:anti-sigma factor [Pseudomonadota bacterium]